MSSSSLTKKEMIAHLKEMVCVLDVHITSCKDGLEYRKFDPKKGDPAAELWLKGGVETLAAWEKAKGLLIEKFPFLEGE